VSTIDGWLRGPARAPGIDAAIARASVMAGLFGGPDGLYRIGRYRLQHALGEGAHGQVFAAWDPELQRRVAIKLVANAGVDAERVRDRRAREARALAKLSHPHVVEVYDVGVHEDAVFIVMELVEGDDLERFVARARPSVDEIVAMFVAAARGLAAAHREGIVHRDFKPTNVLVGDEKVKVADFGLAHADIERTGDDDPIVTQPGAGTPIYMAPEQHLGSSVDARADQYAFCVALWEAIAGRPPFAGARASALLEAKLAGVGDRRPARCSRAVVGVLRRGLQPEPAHRFRTMDELVAALERAGTRRVGVMSVAAAAIAIGLVAFLAAPADARVQACEGAATWDADRREAIVDALAARGAEADRTVQTLDAYAQDWDDAHHEACARADARAAQQCLRRADAELEALVDALGDDPDANVIARSLSAAHGLPQPAACLDADTTTSPEHQAIDRRIARARSLRRAAEHRDALAEAERAVADADRLDADARVPAIYELGRVHESLERWDEAEIALESAYFLAQAHAMPSWSAAAATRLAVVQLGRRDPGATELWLRHAEAALQRAGSPREHHAAYLSALANHLVEHARFDEALPRFDEALALHDDPEGRASLLHGRARAHQELGDIAAAERDIVDALALQEPIFGPEHPQLLPMRVQLGNLQFLAGRYADARATIERARTSAEHTYAPDAAPMARFAESLGMIAYEIDDYATAAEQHGRALAIRQGALTPDHPDIAVSLLNVAMVELVQGSLHAAIPRLEEATRIFEASYGDAHPNVAFTLNALGSAYADAGRLDRAIEALRRADAIRTETHAPPELRAETLRHLATALARAGAADIDAITERARAAYREAGERFEPRRLEMEAELAAARTRPR
jgi:tetratricopeptide (TPR) repeat protein/tRNA A-37 threonylcarbamoyl transferase component Bud32